LHDFQLWENAMIKFGKHLTKFAATTVCVAAMISSAVAGPVILGGDDLNDHGSYSGGANQQGWRYIQNAMSNILSGVNRPGNNGTVVVLGSAPSTATSGDSCGAPYWAGQVLGKTVTCIDGAAGINAFFTQLAGGTVNPAMLIYPGDGASNGVDSAEEAAITANAPAIAAFVASGGGLLGHTGPYGFLPALLPGFAVSGNCDSSSATLTPTGQAAFPLVTVADIRAGPCHNTFAGNFGALQILALDSNGLVLIVGGGAGTVIGPAGPLADIPTMSEWAMILMALLVAGLGMITLRRRV
jgi:hypothetical protein